MKTRYGAVILTVILPWLAHAQATDPNPTHELRKAHAHFVVVKSKVTYDANKKATFDRQTVCDQHIEIPVYEDDGGIVNVSPQNFACDVIDGADTYLVGTAPMMLYYPYALYPGAPKETFKSALAFSYAYSKNANDPKTLPPPLPYQSFATRDLTQVNFILRSAPSQGVICKDQNDNDCQILNPLAFEVILDIMDDKQ